MSDGLELVLSTAEAEASLTKFEGAINSLESKLTGMTGPDKAQAKLEKLGSVEFGKRPIEQLDQIKRSSDALGQIPLDTYTDRLRRLGDVPMNNTATGIARIKDSMQGLSGANAIFDRVGNSITNFNTKAQQGAGTVNQLQYAFAMAAASPTNFTYALNSGIAALSSYSTGVGGLAGAVGMLRGAFMACWPFLALTAAIEGARHLYAFAQSSAAGAKEAQGLKVTLAELYGSTEDAAKSLSRMNNIATGSQYSTGLVREAYKQLAPALKAAGMSAEETDKFIMKLMISLRGVGDSEEEAKNDIAAFAKALGDGGTGADLLGTKLGQLSETFKGNLAESANVVGDSLKDISVTAMELDKTLDKTIVTDGKRIEKSLEGWAGIGRTVSVSWQGVGETAARSALGFDKADKAAQAASVSVAAVAEAADAVVPAVEAASEAQTTFAEQAAAGAEGLNKIIEAEAKIVTDTPVASESMAGLNQALSSMGNEADKEKGKLEELVQAQDKAKQGAETETQALARVAAASASAASGLEQAGNAATQAGEEAAMSAAEWDKLNQSILKANAAASQGLQGNGLKGGGGGSSDGPPATSMMDWGNDVLSFSSEMFSGGGISHVGTGRSASVPASAFVNAPRFAGGGLSNDPTGIPAVLHPNEAVVPLTGGGAIPVDLTGLQNSLAPVDPGNQPGGYQGPSPIEILQGIKDETNKVWEAINTQTELERTWFGKLNTTAEKIDADIGLLLTKIVSLGTSSSGSSSSGSSGSSGGSSSGSSSSGGMTAETIVSAAKAMRDQIQKNNDSRLVYDSGDTFMPSNAIGYVYQGKVWARGMGPVDTKNAAVDAANARLAQDFVNQFGAANIKAALGVDVSNLRAGFLNGGDGGIANTIFNSPALGGFSGASKNPFGGAFAKGSPNASKDSDGGFSATLHPDEAVIPLPDGRSVPVAFSDGAIERVVRQSMDGARAAPQASGSTTNLSYAGGTVTVNMTIQTPDAGSFRASQNQIMRDLQMQLNNASRVVGSVPPVDDPTRVVRG